MYFKPKIIFTLSDIYLPSLNKSGGGGTISNYLLIKYLANYYRIHVITSNLYLEAKEVAIDDITYYNLQSVRLKRAGFVNDILFRNKLSTKLEELIHSLKPDLIVGQTNTVSISVPHAKHYNIASAVWIRAFENFHNVNIRDVNNIIGVNKFFKSLIFKKKDKLAVNKADLVFTNSNFMKEQVDTNFKVNSKVIYPPVEHYSPYIKKHANNIGFIKPVEEKGLSIFLDIVKKMPERNFVAIGEKPLNAAAIENNMPNLKFTGWISSFEKIYSLMKILLVPSLCDEAFGRVAIEALSYGVIPIVSKKGGLPEAVGNTNELIINDILKADSWVSRVNYILDNESLYNELLNKRKTILDSFTVNRQGKAMKDIIDNLLAQEGKRGC